MRLWRVGGDCRARRVASLRCFSTMMPSMSSKRAISVRSGVMGIDSVAKRTRVDILKIESKFQYIFGHDQILKTKTNKHWCIYPQGINGIPLHLLLGQILSHLPGQMIEPVKCAGMEESVSRFPEYSRHLVVVVGHQLWFGRLLGKSKQAMDVLNSLECFLRGKRIIALVPLILHSSCFKATIILYIASCTLQHPTTVEATDLKMLV